MIIHHMRANGISRTPQTSSHSPSIPLLATGVHLIPIHPLFHSNPNPRWQRPPFANHLYLFAPLRSAHSPLVRRAAPTSLASLLLLLRSAPHALRSFGGLRPPLSLRSASYTHPTPFFSPCPPQVGGDEVVWYRIDCKHAGIEAAVHRRFRDFNAILHELKLSFKGSHLATSLPSLPPKEWKLFQDHSDATFIENRRAALETFLRSMMRVPRTINVSTFRQFLGISEGIREVRRGWMHGVDAWWRRARACARVVVCLYPQEAPAWQVAFPPKPPVLGRRPTPAPPHTRRSTLNRVPHRQRWYLRAPRY